MIQWVDGSFVLALEIEPSSSTTYALYPLVLVTIVEPLHRVIDAKHPMLYKPSKTVVGWSDGVADRLWGSGRSKQQPSGALRAKDSNPGRLVPLGGSK